VQCTTCTSVCPVVAAAGDSGLDLDATPQQIMNLVRLGLVDLALGSRMVWDCLTCYQCQENCPQGIAVTDILYELRNEAWGRLGAADRRQPRGAVEEAS
jgi:heterodisulfide reductase subunit C